MRVNSLARRIQMDYTMKDKDIVLEIEKFMNNNSIELMRRMKRIIDKFELHKTKKTEEDFKMEFTPILTEIAAEIDVKYEPKFEKYVKSGRMDCFYNCIDLEYKVPGAIEPVNNYQGRKSSNLAYIEEVHRQIQGYSITEKINKNKILGIIFDGKYLIYTYYLSTDWHVSAPQKLNETTFEEFLKRLFSTEIKGKAVCVSNLVEDFGVDSDISKKWSKSFMMNCLRLKAKRSKYYFLSGSHYSEKYRDIILTL